MINLTALQQEIKEWSAKNFGKEDETNKLLLLAEEVGELCRAELKYKQGVRSYDCLTLIEQTTDAVGDIAIALIGYCITRHYNFEMILDRVWSDVRQRNWVEYPHSGVDPKGDNE